MDKEPAGEPTATPEIEDQDDFVPPIVKDLKDFDEAQSERIFRRTVFPCGVCFEEKLGKECLKFASKFRLL